RMTPGRSISVASQEVRTRSPMLFSATTPAMHSPKSNCFSYADRQVIRTTTSVMEIAESDSLANWESRSRLHASMIPRLINDAKSSTPCGVRHGAAVPYKVRGTAQPCPTRAALCARRRAHEFFETARQVRIELDAGISGDHRHGVVVRLRRLIVVGGGH